MIIGRAIANPYASRGEDSAATESGLQTHSLILLYLQVFFAQLSPICHHDFL
jgi:hypothetical protein